MKIKTGQGLKDYLTEFFEEGVKSALAQKALTEKEKQDQTVDSLFGDDGNDGDDQQASPKNGGDNDGKVSTSKTMDSETEKLQNSDVDAKDIVEKLNSIRSGKSFKDSAVAGPMEEWINSLSKTERVALFAFLKGLAGICTGEVPAQQAEKPEDHPSDVKMDKTNEPHVVKKKPNVIKTAGDNVPADQPVKKKGAPEEDTSAPKPAPITPKRR